VRSNSYGLASGGLYASNSQKTCHGHCSSSDHAVSPYSERWSYMRGELLLEIQKTIK
jgi:hypothetical protein